MKIFDKVEKWCTKVNFVDCNNVFVGYDMTQDCCEIADWFIANQLVTTNILEAASLEPKPSELPGWVFDAAYFNTPKLEAGKWGDTELEAGSLVVFRLVNEDKEKFLHLFNCHNGYYSHGFEFRIEDDVQKDGYL